MADRFGYNRFSQFAIWLALLSSLAVSSNAANDVWTGTSSPYLSDPSNWSPAVTPAPGDNLSFGSSILIPNILVTNDYPVGTMFGNISISEGMRAYTLGGNQLVVTNGIGMFGTIFSPQATVACDISLLPYFNGAIYYNTVWSATRSVRFTGNINLNYEDLYLNVSASGRMTFSGTVLTTGGGGNGGFLILTNVGTVLLSSGATLAGTNSQLGGVAIQAGTLQLDGAATNGGAMGITIDPQGRLIGTGLVDQVSLGIYGGGGIVSPGDSAPGVLHCGTAYLAAQSLADPSVSYGATLHFEIDGTTPGTGYSQLAISTECLLTAGIGCYGDAVLDVHLGYAPQLGDSFQIISGPAFGTFTNLPYNSVFDLTNGYSFGVAYSHITGVTLTTLLTTNDTFALWKGSTNLANRDWSSPDSWAQGVVPASGGRAQFTPYQFRAITGPQCDILVTAPPMTNDLTAGTSLASLLFTDTNYVIYGNPLTITEGITNASTGTNSFFIDLVPTGPLTLESDSGGTLVLGGGFDGSGTLDKEGGGDLRYVGTTMSSFVGNFLVNAGSLHVDGLFTDGSFTVNGGLLGGTGTVSSVTMNGGTLSAGDSPGIFHIQGNLTMSTGAEFQAVLNSPAPGSGYGQLQVSGAVALNGAALNLQPGYNAATGTAFLLLINRGAAPIAGTFGGLAEGSVFSEAGQYFSISYKAGPNTNDVLLTKVHPPGNVTNIMRLNDTSVELQGMGGSNISYIVRANTNLTTTNWLNIGTAPADASGYFFFTDTNALTFPQRFFRIQTP